MFGIALVMLAALVTWLAVLRMAGQLVALAGGSTANIGYGSALAVSLDGAAFNNVAQVVDINGPDVSVKSVQMTNNDSPNANGVGFHEKIPGLVDAGSVTVNIIHKKATLVALYALVGLLRYWRITYVDGTVWTCQGFITKMPPGDPLEGAQTIDLTIEWTGKPTLA